MIKVTVVAGAAKFTDFEHDDMDIFVVRNSGVLELYKQPAPARPYVSYAPGAWLRVENDSDTQNS